MVISPVGKEWRKNAFLPQFGLTDPLGAKRLAVYKQGEVPNMANKSEKKWVKQEALIVTFEKEGDEISGVYVATEPGQQFGNKVYKISNSGKTYTVFGTAVLDSLMGPIAIGSEVKIVFVGTKPNKNKALNDIKLFEVSVLE